MHLLSYIYLENSEHRDGERVEVGGWSPEVKIKCSTKELHSKKCKDQDEQKQKQQKWYNGLQRGKKWHHEIA